jgi:nucleotide-binding universal stress UspA family protein
MTARRGSRARAVVHATDFSPASRLAFRTALAWARRRGVGLDLVHVLTPPSPFVTPAGMAMPAWQDLQALARRDAQRRLDRLTATARRAGARVHAHLPSGLPDEEVARLARRRHAALVVIGTHGRTGIRRAFLGSVAERIVRTAPCPVLTVRAA